MAISPRSISPQSELFDFGLWLRLVERLVRDKFQPIFAPFTFSLASAKISIFQREKRFTDKLNHIIAHYMKLRARYRIRI